MTDLEFVNDWSELEEAVRYLKQWAMDEPSDTHTIDVIVDYVPRLLTQYASLLELSLTLTGSWEEYARLNPPSGLHLPDHR